MAVWPLFRRIEWVKKLFAMKFASFFARALVFTSVVVMTLSCFSSQVSFLFSDRGTPQGFRHMNGYGSHTFKMVNADDEAVYCKFHFKVCVVCVFYSPAASTSFKSEAFITHIPSADVGYA